MPCHPPAFLQGTVVREDDNGVINSVLPNGTPRRAFPTVDYANILFAP